MQYINTYMNVSHLAMQIAPEIAAWNWAVFRTKLSPSCQPEFASFSGHLLIQEFLRRTQDIMVPNVGTLHEEVALIAQKANRHILLEKPISATRPVP